MSGASYCRFCVLREWRRNGAKCTPSLHCGKSSLQAALLLPQLRSDDVPNQHMHACAHAHTRMVKRRYLTNAGCIKTKQNKQNTQNTKSASGELAVSAWHQFIPPPPPPSQHAPLLPGLSSWSLWGVGTYRRHQKDSARFASNIPIFKGGFTQTLMKW